MIGQSYADQGGFFTVGEPISFETLVNWYGLKKTPVADVDRSFNAWIVLTALSWTAVFILYGSLYVSFLAYIVFFLAPLLLEIDGLYVAVFALLVLVACWCTQKLIGRKKKLKDDISANTAMYELVRQMYEQHIFPQYMEKDNFAFHIEKTGYKRYSVDFNLWLLGLGNVNEMNVVMPRVFENMGCQNSMFSINEEWEYGQGSFRFHVFLVMTNKQIKVDDNGAEKLIPHRVDGPI